MRSVTLITVSLALFIGHGLAAFGPEVEESYDDYPFLVSVDVGGAARVPGVLIHPRYVVTFKDVERYPPSDLLVIKGDTTDSQTNHPAVEMYSNDYIAIIKVCKRIQGTPMSFSSGFDYQTDTNGTILAVENLDLAHNLYSVSVDLLSDANCLTQANTNSYESPQRTCVVFEPAGCDKIMRVEGGNVVAGNFGLLLINNNPEGFVNGMSIQCNYNVDPAEFEAAISFNKIREQLDFITSSGALITNP